MMSQGQLRNKKVKKTTTNQSYSHVQMQNEMMKELTVHVPKKQFHNTDEA